MIDSTKNAQPKPACIASFDDIAIGELPTRLRAAMCGNTGSGKTVLGMELLICGILD